jgi:hypothetical protein
VSDENVVESDAPMSTRAKVVAGAVAVVVVLCLGYLMLRLSSPVIPPTQKAPAGHYPFRCGLCHSVSPGARTIGVS